MNQQRHVDSEQRGLQGPMYHYTSLDAVLSIFEQKALRATSVYYLNDASESELGLSVIRSIATEQEATADGLRREFLRYFIWWIDNRYLFEAGSVYVLCFSEACNHLSQWRGYTPHGRGICLGIDIGLLVSRMQQMGTGWTFQNCRYQKAAQLAWASAILSRIQRLALEDSTDTHLEDRFGRVIGQNASDLFQTAALMKNEAFQSEREVRFISPLIRHDDPRVKFRAGRSTLIPYIEFSLVGQPNELLSSVDLWIGPGPTQRLSHAAIAHANTRLGFARAANYHSSEIPYREI